MLIEMATLAEGWWLLQSKEALGYSRKMRQVGRWGRCISKFRKLTHTPCPVPTILFLKNGSKETFAVLHLQGSCAKLHALNACGSF